MLTGLARTCTVTPALRSTRSEHGHADRRFIRWPLLRHLIIGSGTLFLERDRRRDALRINGQARDALVSGDTIAIFPEGTTSDGTGLLPFHLSLLQPVIDALMSPGEADYASRTLVCLDFWCAADMGLGAFASSSRKPST